MIFSFRWSWYWNKQPISLPMIPFWRNLHLKSCFMLPHMLWNLPCARKHLNIFFMSSVEPNGVERDSLYLHQREEPVHNLSLTVSWIHFGHKTSCISENCNMGTVDSRMLKCNEPKGILKLRMEQLKCLNFSSMFHLWSIDYYYISLSSLNKPSKYFSWEEASEICFKKNGSLPQCRSKRDTILFSKMLKLSRNVLPCEAVFVRMNDNHKVGSNAEYLWGFLFSFPMCQRSNKARISD